MIRKWLATLTIGVLLSGCIMAPMALIGPATSGINTASLIQSGVTSSANYVVKINTGKTLTQHAVDAIIPENLYNSIAADILKQAYFPEKRADILIAP
tara:strand:- start:1546 stop:1839 length:294 start_codon:yes stop_codon:yes gene_type:complete